MKKTTFLLSVMMGAATLTGCKDSKTAQMEDDYKKQVEPPVGKMTYRVNPKTKEKVSILGYGMMRLPTANGGGSARESQDPIEKIEKVEERKEPHPMEFRNTPEYINAYAEYIKTGDDHEVRALLTENSAVTTGTVAVPELVYDIVKTAWEKEGIMSLVRKAYLKGNLKVGFEASAGDATLHTQEGSAVDEESLVLGTVELVPVSIKKWINLKVA